MYSVLYVDDEPGLLEIGKIYLELSKGITVDTAGSAKQALAILSEKSFDAIVSDYQMPEMDGLQFLSNLRKEKPHLPFIIFTGRGREEVAVQAFEKGADFYLQKGGDPRAQFAELSGKIRIAVDRRRAEERVSSLNRFYSMLTATIRAIIRFRNRETLLAEICRVVVEIGGFRLAWAGIANPSTHRIDLIASSGESDGYLDGIAISADEVPGGRGPTGTAFRNGTYNISNDIASDPRLKAVREAALLRGFRSMAAFPFSQLTPDSGILTIYAGQPGFFDDQIIHLLTEMSEDITFALMTILDEERRKAAEDELRKKNDELNAAYEQMTATDEELRANYDELEQGQRSLAESEFRYRHLTEAITDYIFTVRIESGRAVETRHGPGCEAVTGYTPEDFDTDSSLWIRMVLTEDQAAVIEQADAVLAGKTTGPIEHRIIRKDGSLRWVRNTPVPLTDPAGRIIAYDGIIQDITERKIAEEVMRDSEARFRIMVEQSPVSIQIMDPDGRTVQVNHAFELLWGLTLQDLSDYNILNDTQLDSLGIRPYIRRGFAGESITIPANEYDALASIGKGEKRWVQSQIYPVRDGSGTIRNVIIMHEDITEKHKAEVALHEREQTLLINEERLRMAQAIGRTGSWEYDLSTNRIWGSAEGLHIFGYPPVAKYFPIEDIESCIPERDRVHQALVDLLTQEKAYDLEYTIHPADGSASKEIHSIARLEKDTNGNILRVIGVIQDITERKRDELLIHEMNEVLIQAQSIAHIGSWEYDLSTKIIRWSDETYRIFGYEPGQFAVNLNNIRDRFHPEDLEKHDRILAEAISTRVYHPEEYRIIHTDGTIRTIYGMGKIISDNSGTAVRIIGTIQDITKERVAETQLRTVLDEARRFREALDHISSYIYIKDRQLRYVYANRPTLELFGCSAEDLAGSDDTRFFPAETVQRLREIDARVLAGENTEEEIDVTGSDGVRRIYWEIKTPVYAGTDNTEIWGLCGISTDITERKEAEELLRESEIRYRAFFLQAANGILIGDAVTRKLLHANPAVCRMFGYTEEELTALSVDQIHPEKDRAYVLGEFQSLVTGDKNYSADIPCLRKDGTLFYADISASLARIDGRNCLVGFFIDVTERRNAIASLMQSEERFALAMKGANDGLWDWNLETDEVYYSPRWKSMLGYAENEIPPVLEAWSGRVHPDDLEHVFSEVKAYIDGRNDRFEVEFRMRHKDGSWVYILARAFASGRNMEGRPTRLVGTHVDLTERKRSEEKIRESEQTLHTLLDNSYDAVIIHDTTGKIIEVNRKMLEMYLVSRNEAPGLTIADISSADSRLEDVKIKWDNVLQGKTQFFEWKAKRLGDGSLFDVEVYLTRIYLGGTMFILANIRDITERKKTENAIRQTNRQLNLLTRITRHDILNNVTVILGYVGIAKDQCTRDNATEYFRKIEYATRAIRTQIEFTRIYQDLGTREPQWQDLDSVIRKIQTPSTVTLDRSFAPVEIFADLMLERVMDNLIDNSLRHGGNVTSIRISTGKEKEILKIIYEDNGTGIPTHEKEQIFERGYGKNTGLGLFLVREILSITGLTIRETGVPGEGARFEIMVPKGAYR